MASLTDDQAQTTSYTYNSRGNKLTETYPDHTGGSPGDSTYGIVTFVYDNAGRVLRKQDQLGDTVTHTYDLAGRMTTRAYRTRVNSPSGTIADSDTFTFDRASRMLTAVNGRYTNTVTMTYDPIGRKATEGLTISGRTYTTTSEYNSRGELTKLTYPDSSIAERTYHDTGALHLLKLDGSTISTRTYDDGRRLTGETLGNGVTETRTYSTDNLLTGISYGGTGTSIGNLSYTWDANKNKTSEGFGGTMSGYGFTSAGTTYDDEDRLTGYARTSGTFTQSWNLTKVGDWTSVTTNGTAQNRTHGPTHELLTAGGQSLATDPKGNITLLPTVLSSSLTPQASQLTPVARTGTGGSVVYVQHDQQTIADYPVGGVATTPTNRYVYASYIDEPVVRKAAGTSGTIHYYHRNQQYSITAITTSTGAVAERYAYTAYGQPTICSASGSPIGNQQSQIANRFTFTGREWDETLGLHHFRARWMSPLAGRFLGRDPISYRGSPWGLYALMKSNPLASYDPSGKITVNHQTVWGDCSSGANATFYVSGDGNNVNAADEPVAPCDGYLIEQVVASCSKTKCPCKDGPSPANGSETWLSAYPRKKGDKIYKAIATFSAPAFRGCSFYNFEATYRYLCGIDLQQPLENSPGWGSVPPQRPGAQLPCFKPNSNLTILLGPGQSDPVQTVPSTSGEKPGSANASFNSCCCGKSSDYYLVSYSASDDQFGGLRGLE